MDVMMDTDRLSVTSAVNRLTPPAAPLPNPPHRQPPYNQQSPHPSLLEQLYNWLKPPGVTAIFLKLYAQHLPHQPLPYARSLETLVALCGICNLQSQRCARTSGLG
jgi:hypothetical protein